MTETENKTMIILPHINGSFFSVLLAVLARSFLFFGSSNDGGEGMKCGFIGAGKVGTSFGQYLVTRGIEVAGYYDKSDDAAMIASQNVNGIVFKTLDDVMHGANFIFVTTSDDVIADVSRKLWEKNLVTDDHVLVHMSGALTSGVLKYRGSDHGRVYSLHPLQSFADTGKALEDLEHTYFSLEGESNEENAVVKLLEKMGNPFFEIEASQKSAYHMTACIMSNYLTTLMDFGLSTLESIGIDRKEGFRAMRPLIDGTINNIEAYGTELALTGPIARGDVATVSEHLKNFSSDTSNDERLYKILGTKTLELAQKQKLDDNDKIEKMKCILTENREAL